MKRAFRPHSILPGFGLTMGFTVFYLSLIVLIPLGATFLKTFSAGWGAFLGNGQRARALASYRLSIGASLIAASVNSVLGLLAAWVLVRYEFPGKRIVDALVDLPFALPTAVAGITLTAMFAGNGWVGSLARAAGYQSRFHLARRRRCVDFHRLAVRGAHVQPVLQELDPEFEEAAATLGAGRWQSLKRVVFPELLPALSTGFALAFARAVGEYGSVIFISGNMPMRTEITPLLIVTKLSQYDYAGATALAVATLMMSFVLLFLYQSAPVVEPREIRVNRMATDIANSGTVQGQPIAIGEPRWVRVALISVTLLFLGIFLFLPLIVVFTEAFKKGVEVYFSRSASRMP